MVTAFVCLACLVTRDATPESTVQGVFDSLNKHDWKAVFTRFEGAKVDVVVPIFEKLAADNAAMPKFILKMTTLTTTGDNASGPVSVGFQMGTSRSPNFLEDEVHLHRTAGDWKIVDGKGTQSIFTQLGQVARDPKKMNQTRSSAQKTVILSNMKQIALGVLMYANDNNDKIALDQSNLKARIAPYLRNANLWKGPDGKLLDVRLNPSLFGKSMTAVAEPAQCVMLSIGPKDKLQYFEGQTIIAFVDGHVKLLKKEGLSILKWK
ncbi:MAG: hypothetical protein P4L46_24795 [Fimbriimonas sp.]|nr:hypothetical protein [Fimbriimonas sp.]